ncbi:hypothetical protein CR513_25456, partial [Mucuna pruriens]
MLQFMQTTQTFMKNTEATMKSFQHQLGNLFKSQTNTFDSKEQCMGISIRSGITITTEEEKYGGKRKEIGKESNLILEE